MNEYTCTSHSSALQGQNKDKRNLDADKFQDMITGLQAGPPGDKMNEHFFDNDASEMLGIAPTSNLLQGPRAEDFSDKAKSAKEFMLSEGLLERLDEDEVSLHLCICDQCPCKVSFAEA